MGLATTISAVAFYVILFVIIYANRKRFDFPAKLIAMYRTKIGIKLMHKWGEGAERFVKALATIGIYVGFAGMLLAVWLILKGWFNLLFVPEAAAMFAPGSSCTACGVTCANAAASSSSS